MSESRSVAGSFRAVGSSAVAAGPSAFANGTTSVSVRRATWSVPGSCAIDCRSAASWVANARIV